MMEGEAEVVAVDVKLEYHEDDEINKDDGVQVEEQRVCSLCGDIGFEKSLLLCNKCGFRFQHSYCSRLYPEIDMEKWSCEWCLHEQHHQQKMDTAAAPPVDDYEFERNNKRNKKRKRQRSNSKVFEFLLEIADQSSPEAEIYTKLEAKQNRGDDIEDEKVVKRSSSWSSSSSFGYGYNKRKFDIDIGLESPTSTATATMITTKLISTTTTSTSPREKSSVAAAAGILKKDDHHQEMSTNGRFHKTAVTKNKSNNNSKAALDRWRNLATNKNKLGCRRYKLLADVHC